MNGFHVVWPSRVRQDVLRFLTQSVSDTGRETARLNQALATVEEALERRPTVAGESRAGDLRVLVEPPVCVGYRVDVAARQVTVAFARYSRGKRR
jgi:hypothetical protein